jgi:hypothetical protein
VVGGTSARRAIHSDQEAAQYAIGRQGSMNPSGLIHEVWIKRASDDSFVVGLLSMQAKEVSTVQRQYGASLAARVSQDLHIGDPGSEQVAERTHIMAVRPQRLDDEQRDILVRE